MTKPYIATPQTTAGDKTYLTQSALDLPSMEISIVSPSKDHDLIRAMQNGRKGSGLNLKTPRAGRAPLRSLPNGAPPKGEFTPLMKSALKNNHLRRLSGKEIGAPETPAYLKNGYKTSGDTPALPRPDHSHLYGEDTSSSAGAEDKPTPVPLVISSSVQSTPLAQLPARNGAGGVVGDGNMMTLREQENIIAKIDKENFGLKMKIHFLEEAIAKRGGEFNQAALKENTELKVSRITMQRELHKFRKIVQEAEKDLEIYRLQLEEYKEKMKKRHADEAIKQELAELRNELEDKEAEIKRLQSQLNQSEGDERERIQKMQDEIEDLEADIREKDRLLGEKEDEVEGLRDEAGKDTNAAAELEEELETARRQMAELQEELDSAADEAITAREEREEALEEKRQAEEDLNELREEMSNKSFSTKGLSRQLEEKANKLEDQLKQLREEHAKLQQDLTAKSESEKEVNERIQELERGFAAEKQNLQDELELATNERDEAKRDWDSISRRMQQALDDLRNKTDEKDLLQSRHDALTIESSGLQRDLSKAQFSIRELEEALDRERQYAAENDRSLRISHRAEVDLLTEQIDSLHREINEEERKYATASETWEFERRSLESTRQKAEEQASGLRRTVDKLQESQGTLSGKEMKLHEAVESEKQRHRQEEEVLNRQIKQLDDDVAAKRAASDENRTELSNAKEELRISIREQAALKETVATLEDEVEVLQANLEEEAEYAQQQLQKATTELEDQLQRARKEKQSLQDQLANVNVELHSLRSSAADVEMERDELKQKLDQTHNHVDTFRLDQEKLELKRSKLKLESEFVSMKDERDALFETNAALEQEFNAEMQRASAEEQRLRAEIEQLRSNQTPSSSRDRELTASKAKAERLQQRVEELETRLHESRTSKSPSAAADVSILRRDLSDAREKESAARQREATLKSTSRELKAQIMDLERQIHELQMSKYSARSLSASPSSTARQEELVRLRKDLEEAQLCLKDLKAKNISLEREKRKPSLEEDERRDLHALLKSSTLEAEALTVKVAERDARLAELKSQMKRLREERSLAHKRADAVNHELEGLQTRYENMVERLQTNAEQKGGKHDKEIRGLVKEIQWLRAKWKREEAFRKDLAWSKEFMGLGEQVRVACNEADLKMIRKMGVKPRCSSYQTQLEPRLKLRAAVFAVMASIRMEKLSTVWKEVRRIGDGLKKAKEDVMMRRRSALVA